MGTRRKSATSPPGPWWETLRILLMPAIIFSLSALLMLWLLTQCFGGILTITRRGLKACS